MCLQTQILQVYIAKLLYNKLYISSKATRVVICCYAGVDVCCCQRGNANLITRTESFSTSDFLIPDQPLLSSLFPVHIRDSLRYKSWFVILIKLVHHIYLSPSSDILQFSLYRQYCARLFVGAAHTNSPLVWKCPIGTCPMNHLFGKTRRVATGNSGNIP